MVSALGISFLCCVALTVAVPSPPLSPNFIPANADFEIYVITIDEPFSAESNATDRGTFYDDVISQFFNFQLPAFPGFRQYFSDEDLLDAETPENGPEMLTEKLPEVAKHEPATTTVLPAVESPAPVTESTAQHVLENPALNFGLTNFVSGVLRNMLSGLAEKMQQYKVGNHDDAKSDQPNPEILADEPKVAETSEIEKKIERLFLENDEKDNDLKHGGAKRSSDYNPHVHEFFSVRTADKAETSVINAAEEVPQFKVNEPAHKELLKMSSGELAFDHKIFKLLASFEDEVPAASIVEKPSEVVAEKEVATPEKETTRNVETLENNDPVQFLNRLVQERSGASICEESTEVPSMADGNPETTTKDVPFLGEESTELPVSTESSYIYAPQSEEDSSEFFSSESYIIVPRFEEAHYQLPALTSDIILIPAPNFPASQLSRRSFKDYGHIRPANPDLSPVYPAVPDFSQSYVVIPDFDQGYPAVPELGYGRPAAPKFGRGVPAVPDFERDFAIIPDFEHVYPVAPEVGHSRPVVKNFGRSLPTSASQSSRYNYPVMAAAPHPYAHHLWPQPAAFHPHPFDFLGPQHVMPTLQPVILVQ